MEMASLNSVLKASRLRTSIHDQTMRIRMGMDSDKGDWKDGEDIWNAPEDKF